LRQVRGPEYWEDRADEILVRMEETKDEGAKRILCRIYGDYLGLAAHARQQPDIDAAVLRGKLKPVETPKDEFGT
jgi:hypothetical protein